MSIFKLTAVPLLLVFICSCTSVPLRTIYHLAKTDFMTVNFAHLGAAIRIPEELREGDKGVQMKFSSWISGEMEKASVLEIELEKVTDLEELKIIKPLIKPMTTTLLYKLSDNDVELAKNFRNDHQRRKAVLGKRLQGSVEVVADYCRVNEVTHRPILISNWLQVDKASGLLQLFTDKDLKKELKKSAAPPDSALPLCSE